MISIIKTVLVFSCLATASGAVVPIAFSTLQSSTSTKLVVFHDPDVHKSTEAVAVMQALDTANTYENEYEFTYCDSSDPQNVEELKAAGFKEYPHIFVQTVEGGIEPFGGDLTTESFARYHDFRIMHITSDNVQRMKSSDGTGTVDGAAGMLAVAAVRPVMVKLYEDWCGHCKKVKKHFQFISNLAADTINNAAFLEVECSKVPNNFCGDMGVEGFPTIVLVYQGKVMKYAGARNQGAMAEFLGDKSKWVFEDLPSNIAKFLPAVEENGEENDEDSDDEE
jgi:thiol-disulfide isomerase/thioredoxin